MYFCMYANLSYMCACMFSHTYVSSQSIKTLLLYVCKYIHTYAYMCTYTRIFMSRQYMNTLHAYVHTHTHRQTQTQTYIQVTPIHQHTAFTRTHKHKHISMSPQYINTLHSHVHINTSISPCHPNTSTHCMHTHTQTQMYIHITPTHEHTYTRRALAGGCSNVRWQRIAHCRHNVTTRPAKLQGTCAYVCVRECIRATLLCGLVLTIHVSYHAHILGNAQATTR
jgi:hypothetical protein